MSYRTSAFAGAQQLAQALVLRADLLGLQQRARIGDLQSVHLGVFGAQPIDAGQVFAAQGQRVARHQQGPLQRVEHRADALAQRGERTQARVDDQQDDRQRGEECQAGVG